jgi:hypothetical protein
MKSVYSAVRTEPLMKQCALRLLKVNVVSFDVCWTLGTVHKPGKLKCSAPSSVTPGSGLFVVHLCRYVSAKSAIIIVIQTEFLFYVTLPQYKPFIAKLLLLYKVECCITFSTVESKRRDCRLI